MNKMVAKAESHKSLIMYLKRTNETTMVKAKFKMKPRFKMRMGESVKRRKGKVRREVIINGSE